jgi:hypothetical protein
MKQELVALNRGINDTNMKMDYCQKLDEVMLSQITTPLYQMPDPLYLENRNR